MEALLIFLLIVLVVVVIGEVLALYLKYSPAKIPPTEQKRSTVTHTGLGKRGDMGNQMFEIAVTLAVAERCNCRAVFPTSLKNLPLWELFNLSSLNLEDIVPDRKIRELDNYEHIVIPPDGGIYDIRGYRQSYRYFDREVGTMIRDLFRPRPEILEPVLAKLPPAYAVLHIRRGDTLRWYSNIPPLRSLEGPSLDYFRSALGEIKNQNRSDGGSMEASLPVIICTDSRTLLLPHLDEIDPKATFSPDIEGISPKFVDFCTLYGAHCMAISNSTYSWWAAYLRPGRFITVPTPWWDSRGIVPKLYRLDSDHLHYPSWVLLSAITGERVDKPHHSEPPNNHTLGLYRAIRGLLY